MIYQRGKGKTYWIRFRFAGRFIHESTHTASKTVARDAERQRRRELELSANGLQKRRSLPPTLELAAAQWQQSHAHEIRPNTQHMARFALNRVLPVFGKKLLCDIDAQAIREYQQKRLAQGAQGRTINIEVGVLRQVLKANECWQHLDGKVKMLHERKDVGRALSPDEGKKACGSDSRSRLSLLHRGRAGAQYRQEEKRDTDFTMGPDRFHAAQPHRGPEQDGCWVGPVDSIERHGL